MVKTRIIYTIHTKQLKDSISILFSYLKHIIATSDFIILLQRVSIVSFWFSMTIIYGQ